MRRLLGLACLSAIAVAAVVAKAAPQSLDPNVRAKIDSTPFLLKDSVNEFNSKLFKSASGNDGGNLIYSPFSLHMLLSQAYVGAPTGTDTSKELANLLSIKPGNDEDYLYNYLQVVDRLAQLSGKQDISIQIANKLFAAEDLNIKENFKKALERFYNSDIEKVNFKHTKETTDIINTFVSDKTKGLIDKIFDEDALDGLSRLVMVNAIYFKGKWKFPFESENTETQKFHVDANREVKGILSEAKLLS
jgi:serpin B